MDFGLEQLNKLTAEETEVEFLKCCGSKTWATRMTAARPFATGRELDGEADSIWWALPPADWLEAFRSHPKIGDQQAAQSTSAQARAWSKQEQAGTLDAQPDTVQALATGNREYEEKFGYIFIVCATGKSADEMLAILRQRLMHDPDSELRVAAEEQRKITQLRLTKLLQSFHQT